MNPTCHRPVMLDEVLAGLDPQPGQTVVDGTLGGGGHTRALAARVLPGGRVIAMDRDPGAVARARPMLENLPVTCVCASYADLRTTLDNLNIAEVDGCLLDLGLSSDQLADAERGFSFASDGPLDLRFDASQGRSAAELILRLPEKELADLIFQFGEERFSRRIARRIVEQRKQQRITTSGQLAELVRRCVPRTPSRQRIDPATRTFQALRIAVNDELGQLARALDELPSCVRRGGRLAVISFHSLEDRLVKQAFQGRANNLEGRQETTGARRLLPGLPDAMDRARWTPTTKKPLCPTDDEVTQNPRARSAKLRIAERR